MSSSIQTNGLGSCSTMSDSEELPVHVPLHIVVPLNDEGQVPGEAAERCDGGIGPVAPRGHPVGVDGEPGDAGPIAGGSTRLRAVRLTPITPERVTDPSTRRP